MTNEERVTEVSLADRLHDAVREALEDGVKPSRVREEVEEAIRLFRLSRK